MPCYVDAPTHQFGRMKMCHLWADSLDELLAMVDTIGVKRKWIQGHPTLSFGKHRTATWVHFDIAKGKRDLAVKAGAVECDQIAALEHSARQAIASGIRQKIEWGERRLALARAARQE
jgi:hypothetical protein